MNDCSTVQREKENEWGKRKCRKKRKGEKLNGKRKGGRERCRDGISTVCSDIIKIEILVPISRFWPGKRISATLEHC